MNLPGGTVTFLFTDIEGSTQLWEKYPEAMHSALARHDALMRQAIIANNGCVFKTIGDAFCAAFATASDALAAAAQTQLLLQNEAWQETGILRVRMALHTGEAEVRDSDYFGPTLNRVARLLSTGYGQQTLLSLTTYQLVRDTLPPGMTLLALGTHRLKDLQRPEQVFQALHPALPAQFPPLKSLDNPALPNNLPQQVTSFIGRDKEMRDVKNLLAKTRLLTLTGTGGAGKTRLSLQVAADLLTTEGDGVWLVELAPLTDASLVPQTVASVLCVKEETGQTLMQTLIEWLKPKRLLLILDNCEHLVQACARLADSLLKNCPHIQILASSREALNIAGEQTYRMPPLSLPSPSAQATVENLSQYEAVRLFIERALAVQPDFAVTNHNAPALAQLCLQLDGIPLAIELAAARVRSLSLEDINARLDNMFRLLTGGSRAALPRQQTLRALIDWSYDLLNAQEKMLLCRLSVFAGGWTLEAAEQVCADANVEDWEIVDLLTGLVDKSLAAYVETANPPRYSLLGTVRQYSHDRLEASGEREILRQKHLETYFQLTDAAATGLLGAEQQTWLHRLEQEHANVRIALEWALAHAPAVAVQMAANMGAFWNLAGYLSEGCDQLEQALAGFTAAGTIEPRAPEQTASQAKALLQLGFLRIELGEYAPARVALEQCLILFRQLGDTRRVASALNSLGIIARRQSRYADARRLGEESLAIFRSLGNQGGIYAALNTLSLLACQQGEYDTARELLEENLAMCRSRGDKREIATALLNLSDVYAQQGELITAQSLLEESLAIGQELEDAWYSAYSLSGLSILAMHQNDLARARSLALQALPTFRRVGDKPSIANTLGILGDIACRGAETELAQELLQESFRLHQELGSKLDCIAVLEIFAGLLMARGAAQPSASAIHEPQFAVPCVPQLQSSAFPARQQEATRAAQILGAVEAMRRQLGAPLPPVNRPAYRELCARLQMVLSKADFEAARTAGQTLTLEQAAALTI